MDLPQPRTTEQKFMSAMCGLLAEQNRLLGEIRDRLPAATRDGQPVDGGDGGTVQLKEPDVPPAEYPTDSATEVPQKPSRRQPTKRTTPTTRRAAKGTS